MMSDKGWIKLNRSIQEHWIWNDSEQLKAWLDLIMLANYENKKAPCKGKIITCKRGDVNLSISYLSRRWGWGRNKTRKFLDLLAQDNMIQIKATTNRTTLTLVNYGFYQDKGATNRATNRTTNRATSEATNEPQLRNIKKYKESKEEPAAISLDEPGVETWNGKPIDELSDAEWVEYVNSWED